MIIMPYSDQTSLIPVPSVNIRRTLPAGWIHGEQITTYAEHLQGQQDTIEQNTLLLPTVFMDRLEKKSTDKRAFASALRILNAQVHCMHLNMTSAFKSNHRFLADGPLVPVNEYIRPSKNNSAREFERKHPVGCPLCQLSSSPQP